MSFWKKKRKVNKELLHFVSRLPCVCCQYPPEQVRAISENADNPEAPRLSDPHHITSKGAGGDDDAVNICPMCRRHHNEWEEPWKGPSYVIRSYFGMKNWLIAAERWDVLERYAPELLPKEKRGNPVRG